MKTSHLELSTLKSLTLHIVQLCVSVLITLYNKEKFLQWRLSGGLSNGYSRMLSVILLLCSFTRIIAVDVLQVHLLTGSWAHKQYQVWFFFHEVGLKTNQKSNWLLSYICATVTPSISYNRLLLLEIAIDARLEMENCSPPLEYHQVKQPYFRACLIPRSRWTMQNKLLVFCVPFTCFNIFVLFLFWF